MKSSSLKLTFFICIIFFPIAVLSINDPPVITIPLPEITFNEDDTLIYYIFNWFPFVEDPDVPDEQLAYYVISGNYVIADPGNAAYYFHAPVNWFGRDTLLLVVADSALSDTADLYVNVGPVNDPPVISGFPDSVMFQSDTTFEITIWNFVDDPDDPDSALHYMFFSPNDSLNIVYNSMFGNLILGAPSFSGTAFLEITVTDDSSAFDRDTLTVIVLPPTGIFDFFEQIIPDDYLLGQNYPNPFNPTTTIRFGLPKASHVKIDIYNILGQKVMTLLDERKEPGYHVVPFDGSSYSSGIYFYRFQTENYTQVKKMLLVR